MPETGAFTIDADWLQSRLGTPGLSIVDASWYLPAQKRDARAEYEAAHIPGAVFFDQDAVVDPDSKLPHTLPDAATFARHVGSMGISADDTIVVYDGPGMFSAPRVWWMFRVMGVFQVYVLDGGFDRWKADGRPVTAEPTKIAPERLPCRFRRQARRLARRHEEDRGDRRKPDRRRAAGRPLRRRRAGAARGRARRPHAGREKPAGVDAVERRQAVAAGGTGETLRGGGHRPLEAGGDVLRLGHHGGGDHAGAGDARPFGQPAL